MEENPCSTTPSTRQGRRFEPGTPAYGVPYFDPEADASSADPGRGIMPPASTTTADDLREALAAYGE